MKTQKILTLFVLLIIGFVSFSQSSKEKYTVLKYKSEREKQIKEGTEVAIFFNRDSLAVDSASKSAYGRLISIDENTITVDLDMEYEGVFYSIDSVKEDYSKFTYNEPKTYEIATVEYMTYVPKVKPTLQLLAYASVASALIIAPLFSYDARADVFDGEAYLAMIKPSVAACIITLPLLFKFEDRKIKLKLK